jgi:DHA1 family multidrug resistance protein-like MFS transporter
MSISLLALRYATILTLTDRVLTALMLGYTTLVSAFTSSIFSTATRTVAAQYHVSTEVGLLGLSFYVLGFAFGPILWAPLSELRGRRLPLVLSMFGFSIFQVAVASAKDLQTILLCRFWGGWCSAPIFRL